MENVKAAMENAGSAGKAEAINYQSVKQKFQSYLKHPGSFAVYILTSLAALITVLVLGFIIVYILVKGVPHLTPDLFAWEYNSENVSMLPSIINTLLLTALALVIVVPIGIFSAIYMVEYAKKGNKIVSIVRVTAETLSGIPSIVYGLFGMIFFVGVCNFGNSLLCRCIDGCDYGIADGYENDRRSPAFPYRTVIVRAVSDWAPENCGLYLKLCFRLPCRAFYPVLFWQRDELSVKRRR